MKYDFKTHKYKYYVDVNPFYMRTPALMHTSCLETLEYRSPTKHQSIHRSTTHTSIHSWSFIQHNMETHPYASLNVLYCPLALRETTLNHTTQGQLNDSSNIRCSLMSVWFLSWLLELLLAVNARAHIDWLLSNNVSFFQGTLTLTFFICVSLVCPRRSPGYCDILRIAAQRRRVNQQLDRALAPRRKGSWSLLPFTLEAARGKSDQICR